MTESDTFDTRLEELLADRSGGSIDTDQRYAHVVRRARRRIAGRRIITAAVVSGFFAAAAFVATTANPGRSTPAPVQAPTTTPTTTPTHAEPGATIHHPTFAVFDQPATVGPGGRLQWPALRWDGGSLDVFKDAACTETPPTTASLPSDPCNDAENLCGALTIDPPIDYLPTSGHECGSIFTTSHVPPFEIRPDEMPDWAVTSVEFVKSQPIFIWGIVPDVVTRVTYAGQDVPITNNAFVIQHPQPVADRNKGLPLFFYIGDCRKQLGYVMGAYADGSVEFPAPYTAVECGVKTP